MSEAGMTMRDISPREAIAYFGALKDGRYTVEVKPYRDTRSNEQNKKMWAMLNEIAISVNWYNQHLSAEEWKDVFTAALKKQKVVPGIEGGFVVLGASTRRMSVEEMGDLIELMFSFGAEQGVKFMEDYQQEGQTA